MADNPTAPFTGTGDVTAKVRATDVGSGVVQHVRLDLGVGAAQAQASGAVPARARGLTAKARGRTLPTPPRKRTP